MSDKTPPIGIFPNSGHHYVFAPIPQELQQHQWLLDVCKEDVDPWSLHPQHRWVRYRAGKKTENGQSILGFWVVIESNCGHGSRGFVVQPKREVPPRPVVVKTSQHDTPYVFHDVSEVERSPNIRLQIPVRNPKNGNEVLQLPVPPIFWDRPAGNPIPVDLVVDFGNTRTVALLLEQNRSATFREICHPVRFLPRGKSYEPSQTGLLSEDPFLIVDSWLVLHETMFSDAWPPSPQFKSNRQPTVTETPKKVLGIFSTGEIIREVTHETEFAPHMFAEISPALLGGGNEVDSARTLLQNTNIESGLNFFLSSPKRYAWDGDQRDGAGDPYWHMLLNRWNSQDHHNHLPNLEGPILMFMDTDGRYWKIEEPPNERARPEERAHAKATPIHPRRDSLAWAALAILETSYRQLTSEAFRGGRSPHQPRYLRNVLVTFPSGWTGPELETYRAQWEKAINIFTLTRMEDRRPVEKGGQRPSLTVTNLDEAVAAQLPIIFSEMRDEALGKAWIELVGRGQGADAKVRVLNLDIGGGTTDVSVVEYRDSSMGASVVLEAKLLFRNSSTVAGDALVKRIIECVLLPAMVSHLVSDPKLHDRIARFFRNPEDEWLRFFPAFHQKLARIVRLVFIPIVNTWFKEVVEERYGDLNQALSPGRMYDGSGEQAVSMAAIKELNTMAQKCLGIADDLLQDDQPLPYNQQCLRRCITNEFANLFETLGQVLSAFDCDLVLVSGKPSELPEIRDLLETHFPLLPQRILFAKGFHVGEWYPLGENDGRIRDAKTPTVVGAALYQAMRGDRGWLPGWRLEPNSTQLVSNENYWGAMPHVSKPAMFDKLAFLKPGQTKCTIKELLGVRIGRKRFLSPQVMPDQVYELRWNRQNRLRQETPVLEIVLERANNPDSPETLQLVSVKGKDDQGNPITRDHVELRLCTLSDHEFWMDRPSFEIECPETPVESSNHP